MPPLPTPHTPTQLDEARRRLLLDQNQLSSLGSSVPPQRHSKRYLIFLNCIVTFCSNIFNLEKLLL